MAVPQAWSGASVLSLLGAGGWVSAHKPFKATGWAAKGQRTGKWRSGECGDARPRGAATSLDPRPCAAGPSIVDCGLQDSPRTSLDVGTYSGDDLIFFFPFARLEWSPIRSRVLSPPESPHTHTPGGVPFGFMGRSALFSRRALRRVSGSATRKRQPFDGV